MQHPSSLDIFNHLLRKEPQHTIALNEYRAPLEMETTFKTWSCSDPGGDEMATEAPTVVVDADWNRPTVHRACVTLGEWLQRIVQREDARSATQRRALLHAERSPNHHRTMADALQHSPSAQQSRAPATRARNHPPCELRTNKLSGTNTLGWSRSMLTY